MGMTTGETGVSISTLRGSSRRRRKEGIVRGILLLAAGISLVISLAIVLALLGQAITFLSHVDPSALWSGQWSPRQGEFDIPTLFIGTIEVAVIAMLIAAPLGLGAAMYLSEYASPRTRRRLKPILETLAGIPSVVLGYFALQVINPELVQKLFATSSTFTIMAAGIGVGILTVPLVASRLRGRDVRRAPCAAGGRLRDRSAPSDGDPSCRLPGGGLRHHGLVDPGLLPGDRRDDGGGDRGRRDGLAATRHWNPLEPGQTMTAAIASLAIGHRSGQRASGLTFQSLFFVGLAAVRHRRWPLNLIADALRAPVRSEY